MAKRKEQNTITKSGTVSYSAPDPQPPMKPWYQSRTVWILVLMAVAEIALIATDVLPLNEAVVAALVFTNKAVAVILRLISSTKLTS